MRKMLFLVVTGLAAFAAKAQNNCTPGAIRISGTRLTYPLVEKWIKEFGKTHPGITIALASGLPQDSADIAIVSHILTKGDVKEGKTSIVLNRYVQLPVVNSRRKDVLQLQEKGFTDAAFRQVYFADTAKGSELGAATDVPVSTYHFAVYKRAKPACASIAFANHFGSEQKDIAGTGITGDDKDLLAAVKRDENGITYNNLGFIYNLSTRRVNDSVAVIPLDLNENGRVDPAEKIYNTLDEVIAFTEQTNSPKILTENVHVIFNADTQNKAVASFLQWILTTGQQYNHTYGFLNLDTNTKNEQEHLLALASKHF